MSKDYSLLTYLLPSYAYPLKDFITLHEMCDVIEGPKDLDWSVIMPCFCCGILGKSLNHHGLEDYFEILGFPGGSVGKESACYVEDLGSIPGLGRSPGEWNGYPLQYSGQENSRECIVHGVAKSQTF